MIASFDYTDMNAFSPHDLCSEIWKETGTETSGWLQLKSAQKDGLCHGDVFFLLWFLWQLLSSPDRIPSVWPGRIHSCSHACTRAARSKPCLLTLQPRQIRSIYLVWEGKDWTADLCTMNVPIWRKRVKITESERDGEGYRTAFFFFFTF